MMECKVFCVALLLLFHKSVLHASLNIDQPDSTVDNKESPADTEDSSEKPNGPTPAKAGGEDPTLHAQPTENHSNPPPPSQPPDVPPKQDEDNEFILDGFDFSTGLSICQDLDLDEDEGSDTKVTGGGAVLTHSKPKDPSELSNALLKALGVGKEQESAEPKSLPQKDKQPTTLSTGESCDMTCGMTCDSRPPCM